MNKIIHILSILFLLVLGSSDLQGQSRFSKSYQSNNTIEYVRTILNNDPEEAVKILNKIIEKSNSKRDVETISQAYELLGDINSSNNLFLDAIDRFTKANDYAVISNDKNRIALLNQKIGDAYLSTQSYKAKEYFKICMEYAIPEDIYYSCEEGFADALVLQDSLQKALELYQIIEQKFNITKDPSLTRIQAKIADTYASQNKISEALLNYNNAQTNYSSSNIKDDNVLKKSSENIILNQNNVDQEISLRNSNIGFYSNRPDKVAEEKIQLADAYVRLGKTGSAVSTLNEIKPILKKLPSNTKAEYFKQSSEIANIQGNFKGAIEEYKKYVRYRDSILDSREKSLEQRFNISELQSNIDLNEKDFVNERNKIAFQKNLVRRQQYIIGLLALLLIGALLSSFLIYRNIQAKKKANKLLELRSLRSAMNPHFIFNALGSVNNYIAEKESRKANKYLSDFSKLMRSVLDMNKNDLVPLRDELQIAELYLKLEHGRWSDKFDYTVNIDYDSIPEDLFIPPLLIQPYIENAVWHGLRYKKEKGQLELIGRLENNRFVLEVIDNGIGRKESLKLKTKNQKLYNSTGIQNTKRRTELINDLYSKNYSVNIQDRNSADSEAGTHVRIELI